MESQLSASILTELHHIHRLVGDIEEQYRRWNALWQELLQGDKLPAADLAVAVIVTETGIQIALRQERYQDALDLFTTLSTHPQFAKVEPVDLNLLLSLRMLCLLRLGDETGAAEVGYRVLRPASEEMLWWENHLLCTFLFAYVNCNKPDWKTEVASEKFTSLVVDALRAIDPHAPLTTLPQRATYEQLSPLVNRALHKMVATKNATSDVNAVRGEGHPRKLHRLKCHCGHKLSRQDLLKQTNYTPEYSEDRYECVLFLCSRCQRKSECFIKQAEWDESLLDEDVSVDADDAQIAFEWDDSRSREGE